MTLHSTLSVHYNFSHPSHAAYHFHVLLGKEAKISIQFTLPPATANITAQDIDDIATLLSVMGRSIEKRLKENEKERGKGRKELEQKL